MSTEIQLHRGDMSENGRITIVDEDRLCYVVQSESRGASGLRTISKAILKEFVEFVKSKPDAAPKEARESLSGQSKIDRFEYGYESTILQMAKMVLGKVNVIHTAKTKPSHQDLHLDNNYIPYLTALRTKPFMLLAGISGTGKSRIVRKLAQATTTQAYENNEDRWKDNRPENFELIQVKPNWHNSMDVVGFYSNISKKYEFTPFVEFIVKAWQHTVT